MEWPPWSHEPNIVEDRGSNKRQPKSKEELWRVLKEASYQIPKDHFKKLQVSLPKRIQKELSAKAGHTNILIKRPENKYRHH